MKPRSSLLLLVGLSLAASMIACGPSASPTDAAVDVEGGGSPAPDGRGGLCCPIDPGDCNGFRYGGWAPSLEMCPRVSDAAPPTRVEIDPHGCPQLIALGSCLGPRDAGP